MKEKPEVTPDRRGFLKGILGAGMSAALAIHSGPLRALAMEKRLDWDKGYQRMILATEKPNEYFAIFGGDDESGEWTDSYKGGLTQISHSTTSTARMIMENVKPEHAWKGIRLYHTHPKAQVIKHLSEFVALHTDIVTASPHSESARAARRFFGAPSAADVRLAAHPGIEIYLQAKGITHGDIRRGVFTDTDLWTITTVQWDGDMAEAHPQAYANYGERLEQQEKIDAMLSIWLKQHSEISTELFGLLTKGQWDLVADSDEKKREIVIFLLRTGDFTIGRDLVMYKLGSDPSGQSIVRELTTSYEESENAYKHAEFTMQTSLQKLCTGESGYEAAVKEYKDHLLVFWGLDLQVQAHPQPTQPHSMVVGGLSDTR